MRKLLIIVGIFGFIILGAFLLDWSFLLDDDLYKLRIERLVKKHTGHVLKIAGPLRIQVGWYPLIRIEAVSLSNIPHLLPEKMLEAKAVSIRLVLHDLMRRHLVTKEVTVEDGHFFLQKDASHQWNWDVLKASTPSDRKLLRMYPRIHLIRGRIEYQESPTEGFSPWFFDDFVMDFSKKEGMLSIDLQGRYEPWNMPVSGTLTVDMNPKEIQKKIHFEGEVFHMPVTIEGTYKPSLSLDIHWQGRNALLTGTLKSNAALKDLNMKLVSSDFGAFLKNMALNSSFVGGNLNVNGAVTVGGNDGASWLKTLKGNARVAVLNTRYVGSAENNLGKLLGGGHGGAGVPIHCFVGGFTFENGIATTRGFVFDGTGATVYGRGAINLLDRTLQLQLEPKAKSAQWLSLAVPLQITGPWKDPKVTAEIPKEKVMLAVLSVASGFGVVGALGTEVAANIVGKDLNPCLEALK